MVYEYSKAIQESGINRDIASSGASSYLEMSMMVTYEATNDFNRIFESAGIIELTKYKNNTITEASAKEITTAVIGKIKKVLAGAWARVKAIFESMIKFFREKAEQFVSNVGNVFKKINLANYKTSLNKAFGKGGKAIEIVDTAKVLDLKDKLTSSFEKGTAELKAAKAGDAVDISSYAAAYGYLLNGNISVKNIDFNDRVGADRTKAREVIEKEVGYDKDVVTADWVINNKSKIYNYITIEYIKEINDAYKKAKKAYSEADKVFDSFYKAGVENIKMTARAELNLTLAYNDLLMILGDLCKKNIVKFIMIAAKAVAACGEGKSDKELAAKEAKQESVTFTTDYVNEVFNW